MTRKWKILIVEDDVLMRSSLAQHLGLEHLVLVASSGKEALDLFGRHMIDLVILDLNLPDGDGLSLIATFRQDGETEVVVITAFPKVQSAVGALKAGALDYINKPFDLAEFDLVVAKTLKQRDMQSEISSLRRMVRPQSGVNRILGETPAIVRVRQLITRVAATPLTTVLVRGESGTGKELVAEAVHHESSRQCGPFMRVNCSSIPATMLEAELFGHERGAFTDAKASRCGLFEAATGGTLFLDEIGDLPIELQPKLLTVLESRTFRRLGGNRERNADVRIVAATNRDLEAMISAGTFRKDLLYRLKVFEIVMPPLRERRPDIEMLSIHFLAELRPLLGGSTRKFAPKALQMLTGHSWPGNARELRNVLERSLILSDSETITAMDLMLDPKQALAATCMELCPANPENCGSFSTLAEIELRYIKCVHRRMGGNKTRAAEILGISRLTLREKLKQIGIDEESTD